MPRKKRVPLGEGVIGKNAPAKPVKWSVSGALGNKYTAQWGGEKVRLEVNGGFVGDVLLREGAGEEEAKHVAEFYLGHWVKREAAGFTPSMK